MNTPEALGGSPEEQFEEYIVPQLQAAAARAELQGMDPNVATISAPLTYEARRTVERAIDDARPVTYDYRNDYAPGAARVELPKSFR